MDDVLPTLDYCESLVCGLLGERCFFNLTFFLDNGPLFESLTFSLSIFFLVLNNKLLLNHLSIILMSQSI